MWPFCHRQPHRHAEHTDAISCYERLSGPLQYDAPVVGCVLVHIRFSRGL